MSLVLSPLIYAWVGVASSCPFKPIPQKSMLAYRQLLFISTSSVVMFGTGGLAIAADLLNTIDKSSQYIDGKPVVIASAKAQQDVFVFEASTDDVAEELEAIAQAGDDIQSVPTLPAEEPPEVEPQPEPPAMEMGTPDLDGAKDVTNEVEEVVEDEIAEDVEMATPDADATPEVTSEVEAEVAEDSEEMAESEANSTVEIEIEALPPESETASEMDMEVPTAEPAEAAIVEATPRTPPNINNIPDELRLNQDLQNLLDPVEDVELIPPVEVDAVLATSVVDLTLQDVIERAITENIDLREAQLSYERAEYQLREAIALEYPTLTNQTDLSFTETTGNELAAEAANTDEAESTDAWNNRIELSYNVYTGGQRTGQIGAAETQLEILDLDIARITKEIQRDAATTYYDLQSADAQVVIEGASLEDASRSLRDAELLEKAGLGTKFDVLRAEVEVANAQQRLTLAEANQRTVRRQLARLINLQSNVDPRAADPIDLAGRWNLTLEESILLAIQQREELRQQLLQREIDVFQEQIAVAAIRPQLSVFANYDLLDVFGDGFSPADGFSFGARVRWNLYDGGAAKARESQEQVDQLIAENRYLNQTDQIRLAVETAYYNLTASSNNIETASIAVELAEESLRLARMRFRAGVGTQTDVISAATELTTARNNFEQTVTDYNRAYAQLKREVSVGEELELLSR